MGTTDLETGRIDHTRQEAFENGEVGVIDEVLDGDSAGRSPTAPRGIRGPDAFNPYILALREAFPGSSVAIDLRIVTDDAVVARYTTGGTHEGEFNGIRPTGTETGFGVITIHHVEDGKIVTDASRFDVRFVTDRRRAIEPPGDTST